MTKNLKFWKICTQQMNFYLVKIARFRCKMKMFLRYLYKVPKDFTLLTKIVFSFHLQVSHSYTNKTNCFWSKIIFSVGGAARGQVGVRLLIFTCRPLLAAGSCSIFGPGGGGGGNSSCVIINQMHIRVIVRKGCLNTNSAHFNSDNLIVVERHLQGPPKYFWSSLRIFVRGG